MSIWTEKLSVGNRIIDSEHKKLHNTISEIADFVVARDVAKLTESLVFLEDCIHAYFVTEERIAQAVNFDFTQHRLAHQRLLEEFRRVKSELISKDGMWSDDVGWSYAHSLKNCLVKHIRDDGKPLKILLDTYFYDFEP